jgi:glucokinase
VILGGDVGGTKTVLALFRRRRGRLEAVKERTFPSRSARSFLALLDEFLDDDDGPIVAAGVGVAGPVVHGRSQVVNVRWPVDARAIARRLRIRHAHVINDLEATAWGIPELSRSRVANLTPGLAGTPGNAALIAAGTGLGMAILFWDGERFRPSASEGGHQGFGPRDDLEIALLEWLRRKHGRASVERVVSGPGLGAIYEYLVDRGWAKPSPAMRARKSGDPNARITQAALAGTDAVARKALEMFVTAYGAAAGDLALVARASAGVWVGGGIAPKILPALRRSGAFVRAFRDKGRLSRFVERIPIRVILEPRTALLGAAACAAHRTVRLPGRAARAGKKK